MSTCAMTQPPKMSPFWFASAGIGMTRSAGCLSFGRESKLFLRSDVLQRPPSERREPGAEDEPGIDQIGIGDDALAQHRLGFLQVRLDHLLHQRLVERVGLALHRLSIIVEVEALNRFHAYMPERAHFRTRIG